MSRQRSTPTTSSGNAAASASTVHRRFRGIPAKERQDQRRTQLLEAGFEIFGTSGFQGAGVRELCAAAKLTERYFYESFENREALFDAVYKLAVGRIGAAVTEALRQTASKDGPTLARAVLRATLEACRSDPRLPRILYIEVLSKGAGSAALTEIRAYEELIGQLIINLYPELDKRRVDVGLLARGLHGSTMAIITRWAVGGFRDPLERVLNHCALFYESLTHELQRRHGVANDSARRR